MRPPNHEMTVGAARTGATRICAGFWAWLFSLYWSFPAASSAQVGKPGTTTVVPDQFLRRWDPVTIFFAAPTGPAAGGPEDAPARYVKLEPAQPGAYTWLDARTLQFRPAEPWPPLAAVTLKVEGKSFRLVTLLSAPTSSQPANGAEGLPPLEAISLTFPEPMAPEALARAVTIEHRPLPGLAGTTRGGCRARTSRSRASSAPRPATRRATCCACGSRFRSGARSSCASRCASPMAAEAGAARGRLRRCGERARLLDRRAVPRRALRLPAGRSSRWSRAARAIPASRRSPAKRATRRSWSSSTPRSRAGSPRGRAPRSSGATSCASRRQSPNLAFTLAGKRLEARGDFARETAYRVTLAPALLRDQARPDARPHGRERAHALVRAPGALPALERRRRRRGAQRPEDGAGRRARRRTARPAPAPDRSARPLVLAVPRPSGRGRREPAAPGPRRAAAAVQPGRRRRSRRKASRSRSPTSARPASRCWSTCRCAATAPRRRSASISRPTWPIRARLAGRLGSTRRAPTSSACAG